ncbi:hypothetical protein [Bizionia psychrotolerans]|uniref:hypothetical protein n=1 Tax=Bizionia psychrotolerans TaxID=1492901 RepID=UPI00065192CB|nr:hypothetical protein [Bizionia psychrotolerans]
MGLSSVSAQKHFALIETERDFPDEKLKEVFSITDNKSETLALILQTKKGLESYLYHANKERINHISIKKVPSKSDVLVGNANVGNNYRLFYSNKSESQFSMFQLNFDDGSYQITEDLNLDISGEKILKYISQDDKLYLLTLKRFSSILKLYTFNMEGHVTTRRYDLSNEKIENDNGLTYDLSTLIYQNNVTNRAIEYVDVSVPNSLEAAAAITKIYFQDDQLIITNNLYTKFTYKIAINIHEESYSFEKIENNHFKKDDKLVTANSFIIKNHILTTYANGEQVFLDIYKADTSELIKTFTISKGEDISFKNTPIMIENGDFSKLREVEKSAKFIRKISYSNIGISAFEMDNQYVITLGASEPSSSGSMIIIGYVVGGVVGAAIFSAFESYSETKSTRIQCLFDSDFNHVQGSVPKNGFDQIQDFVDSHNFKTIEKQTVFKFQDNYVWGSFDWTTGYYRLYTFSKEK